MIRTCAITCLALAVSVTVAAAPANAKANKVSKTNTQNGHGHHLLKAEQDLRAAQAAIAGGNLKQAHKDVAATIHQIEEAIQHHHKNHIATQGQANTKHHDHHALLKRVVAELRVAEKELNAGAAAQASKEIQKAEKTLESAIASHKQLFKQ